MSSLKWQMGAGLVMYVFDVTTATGTAQMYLGTEWPEDDASSLTATDTAMLAAALTTAISALSGVTGCTQTELAVTGPSQVILPRWVLEFDSASWASWTLGLTILDGYGFTNAYLYSTSPADGQLTQTQMDSLAAVLVTSCSALSDVTSCVSVQDAVTPVTV